MRDGRRARRLESGSRRRRTAPRRCRRRDGGGDGRRGGASCARPGRRRSATVRSQCSTTEESRSAPIEPLSRRAAAISRVTHGHTSPRQRAWRARECPVSDGRRRRGRPERSAGPPRTEAGCEGWEGWAKRGTAAKPPVAGGAAGPRRPGPERPWDAGAASAVRVSRTPGDACPGRCSAVATACSLVSAMTASSLDTTG